MKLPTMAEALEIVQGFRDAEAGMEFDFRKSFWWRHGHTEYMIYHLCLYKLPNSFRLPSTRIEPPRPRPPLIDRSPT